MSTINYKKRRRCCINSKKSYICCCCYLLCIQTNQLFSQITSCINLYIETYAIIIYTIPPTLLLLPKFTLLNLLPPMSSSIPELWLLIRPVIHFTTAPDPTWFAVISGSKICLFLIYITNSE